MDVIRACRRKDAECRVVLNKIRRWFADYNGNGAYLSWDGVDISGFWTDQISFKTTNKTEITNSGASATDVKRQSGLNDRTMGFQVRYDDASATLATYVEKLEAGTRGTLIFGPEGQVAGKPKFQGTMILKDVDGPNPHQEKKFVKFDLMFEQAEAPTATITGGDTF